MSKPRHVKLGCLETFFHTTEIIIFFIIIPNNFFKVYNIQSLNLDKYRMRYLINIGYFIVINTFLVIKIIALV